MYRNSSFNLSTDSDVFYVEQSSPERSPIRHNTPTILNSTQLSGTLDPETNTISSVASPEPQIVTIESDSNEPTFPYAFGAQYPIVPPSLNDLNLPTLIFLMYWHLWRLFSRINRTAPNHQSRLIHPQFQLRL